MIQLGYAGIPTGVKNMGGWSSKFDQGHKKIHGGREHKGLKVVFLRSR